MKSYFKNIENFDQIITEREINRKYGTDYHSHKGKTDKIIDRYHPKNLNLVVIDIIAETDNVKTIRLSSENGYLPPFQAGQYINVYGEVENIQTSRPYSISSSPRQRAYYDITVAKIENGFFSDHLLNNIKKGDKIQTSSPSGQFYYNPIFHSKKSVFIAGGSGITPFMSMLREINDAGLDREITLFYGNRDEKNIIFHKELLEISSKNKNIKYIPVFSQPQATCTGKQGFIDAKCIKEEIPDIADCTYYICGPQAMYDFVLPQLESLNIPGRWIRKEMFSSAGDITKESGWPSNLNGSEEFSVKVKGAKTIKAKSGETLLSSLERAGIVVPVKCRSGECSICRVKLVSGKVFIPQGVHIREADRKFGYVHSCKCYPLENLEIIL